MYHFHSKILQLSKKCRILQYNFKTLTKMSNNNQEEKPKSKKPTVETYPNWDWSWFLKFIKP